MKILKKLFVGFFVLITAVPVFAADDSCTGDDTVIKPEFALCSTHVYNIGADENPSSDNRQLMRDTVAMKTTFIAQQLYRKYDEMEAMVRRLKTQMEKAIFADDIKALNPDTASSDSDSGGAWVSDNRAIHIYGARDCDSEYDIEKALECYAYNLNFLKQSTNNGSGNITTEAEKQLIQDYCGLKDLSIPTDDTVSKDDPCEHKMDIGDDKGKDICGELDNKKLYSAIKPKDFRGVLDKMNKCLRNKTNAYKRDQRQVVTWGVPTK